MLCCAVSLVRMLALDLPSSWINRAKTHMSPHLLPPPHHLPFALHCAGARPQEAQDRACSSGSATA